jgi:hypothetical protein
MYRYNDPGDDVSWNEWVIVSVPVLVIGLVVASGFRRPTDREIDRWIEVHEAPADERTRHLAARYLAYTRRARFSFAFAGFLGARALPGEDATVWANPWLMLVAGYLVGSIVAEVAFGRPDRPRGTAAAALSPRTLGSYLPRYAIVALVATPIASAAVVLWQVAVASDVPWRLGLSEPATVIAPFVFGAVVTLVAAVSIRAIVRRPQPADRVEAIAADDAFRSSSMHAIAGAALTLSLFVLAYLLGDLNAALAATGSPFDVAATVASLIALCMALASWLFVRHPPRWRTRRDLASASAGPSA